MKHIRWQALIALVGVLLLGAILAFLAFGSTTIERPDFGGTYIEGIAGRPSAINPLFSQYNDVDRDIVALVFSGLTIADERGEIKPDLARAWTVSPDGLVYTFTLRSDVKWHDGVDFGVEDVLYTVHTLQDPAYKGPPNLTTLWRTITATQVGDFTVRFQLSQPYAPFLSYTTIGILPAHLLKDVAPGDLLQSAFNRHPVGTGPFQIADLSSDSLSLDVNKNYYGQRPYLARIQFKFYPDYESIFAAFGRGEVEGISRILPAYLPKARGTANLSTNSVRLAGYSAVLLNLSKAPFQDKAVRQALLYGTDRNHLINDLLFGQGVVATGPIEPSSWAYNVGLTKYPFDLEKAKALLDAAGWRDPGTGVREKDKLSLAFTFTSPDEPARLALANELAQEWQAIGVKVSVQPVPASLLVQNVLRPRQFDAVLYEWRNFSSDPDQYENWNQTQVPTQTGVGQNYSGLNDKDINEVLEAARRTNDQAKRAELYARFQELFVDRVPALLLYYPVYTYGVDSRVHGVQLAPMVTASDRFRNIIQWYMKTKRIASSMALEESAPTATPEVPLIMVDARSTLPVPTSASAAPTLISSNPSQPPSLVVPTVPSAVAPNASGCANSSVVLKAPAMDSTIFGLIEIRGTATRQNMTYWKLEYRPNSSPTFAQLFRSEVPVSDGVLSLWSTKTVPNGDYWLQLTVVDNTGNFGTSCPVHVNIAN